MLANLLSASGFTIRTLNEFTIIADKPDTSTSSQLLFGTRLAATPNRRVTMNLATTGAGVRIIGRVEIVSNPGTGFERTYDLSDNATDLQQAFVQLKATLEGGAVGVKLNEQFIVTEVAPNSPAEEAGIQVGDHLWAIGEARLVTLPDAYSRLQGMPGQDVELHIMRDGEKLSRRVTRKRYTDVWK